MNLKFCKNFVKNSSFNLTSIIFLGLFISGGFYFYIIIHLPDVNQLRDNSLQIPLKIYTSDGKLIGEFGEKKRIPVTLKEVPSQLINAILDTEDKRFYEHRGVDFIGLLRAFIVYIQSGKKLQGASTITMQVARDYFLNKDKTFQRKINEILLAFKIDSTFNKKEILELYLNRIYFGNRAYGVAAAAQVYYGKSLNELSIHEIAMIAGLPQAPSRNNPIANPLSAKERRNHVLLKMLENYHIDKQTYNIAINTPAFTKYHESRFEVLAPYATEMVRNTVASIYKERTYDSGIKVYTTIDSNLQSALNDALRDGILSYDRRHGYRGPEGKLIGNDKLQWQFKLQHIITINNLLPAAVLKFDNRQITALLGNGDIISIDKTSFSWANPQLTEGDIIRVYKNNKNQWIFAQLPKIEGAMIALNPKNGAILALSGGFSCSSGNYNRAIQAERQTGSAFKPFIYSAALAKNMTLASIINDAPIVLTDPSNRILWRPQNVNQEFQGPTRLRIALAHSINMISIRVLQAIGIPYAINYLKLFGFNENHELPNSLSLALGSGTTTPLKMAVAYSVFANGGYKITPFIIDTIMQVNKNNNRLLFKAVPATIQESNEMQYLPKPNQVITPQNAYLITDALKDVIKYGTATKAKILNRNDLAGKTGTTNNQFDAWFAGYNNSLVSIVWIGFDHPNSIYEGGSKAALPIWIQFMKYALLYRQSTNIEIPPGIVKVKIDPQTGFLTNDNQSNTITELFTINTIPKYVSPSKIQSLEYKNQLEEFQSNQLF